MLAIFAISPQGMNLLAGSRSLEDPADANTIQMCVKETIIITEQPSVGALVQCYDKDSWGADQYMTEGLTGSDGCVKMKYDNIGWDWIGRSPDIYCIAKKEGFVDFTTKMKDGHDQNKLASFDGVLYRDRMLKGDFGKVNFCGPEKWGNIADKFPTNIIGSAILGFGDMCNNHDKCYYDCIILDAFDGNYRAAHDFCDYEFWVEMYSLCNREHGDWVNVGDDACKGAADQMYRFVNRDSVLEYYTEGISGNQPNSCDIDYESSENTSRVKNIY